MRGAQLTSILEKHFELIEKIVRLAGQAESEVVEHVTQYALENAVSAFDAFGREVSRVAAPRGTDPQKAATISVQNINGARNNIQQLFNIDIAAPLTADEWKQVVKAFQKDRHNLGPRRTCQDRRNGFNVAEC